MQELIPLAAGAIVGSLVAALPWSRLRAPLFVVLCLLAGLFASWINGELAVSWGFLTADAALVWLGALVAVSLPSLWRRLSPRLR